MKKFLLLLNEAFFIFAPCQLIASMDLKTANPLFQIDGDIIRLMPVGEGLVASAPSRERNGMSVATLAGGWIHTTGLAPLSDSDGATTVGLAADGTTIVQTNPTLAEQVRYSLFRLSKVLAAFGASWKDVVDVKLYIVADSADEARDIGATMKAAYQDPANPQGHGPAFTFIPVKPWPGKDFKCEISLSAYVAS